MSTNRNHDLAIADRIKTIYRFDGNRPDSTFLLELFGSKYTLEEFLEMNKKLEEVLRLSIPRQTFFDKPVYERALEIFNHFKGCFHGIHPDDLRAALHVLEIESNPDIDSGRVRQIEKDYDEMYNILMFGTALD